MQENKNENRINETVSAESIFAIVVAIIIAAASVFIVSLSKENKALEQKNATALEQIASLEGDFSELQSEYNSKTVESANTDAANQQIIEEQQSVIEEYEQQIEEDGKMLAESDEKIDQLLEIIGETDQLDEVYSRSVSADDVTFSLRQMRSGIIDIVGYNEKTEAIIEKLDAQIAEIEFYEEHYPDYCPTTGMYTSPYGWREDPFNDGSYKFHSGIDISNSIGTPVYAAGGGTVEFAGWISGYGNCLIVNHGNGIKTRYAHLSKMLVSEGDSVRKTDKIALMGMTGRVTGPHLHFEVIVNGETTDPLKYVPKPVK